MTSMMREASQATGLERRARPVRLPRDLDYLRTGIVNVYFFGRPGSGDRQWVLIDTGMPGSASAIARHAAERFGAGARPSAIILTHGHFDHVGAVEELSAQWDVPVYAHELELPYLTGRSSYPPPDPTVGGGLMASLSWLYPRGPINLGDRVRTLPEQGTIPGMSGWKWIHTPGHTAGHVSLYRTADETLIAGDAFITVKQESMMAVLSQRPEVHGPPAYYTTDWEAARRSVEQLAALQPRVAATGHGIPMGGRALRDGLQALLRDWEHRAVPRTGRYVHQPAITDRNGVVSLPPDIDNPIPRLLVGFGAGLALGLALSSLFPARRRHWHIR